MHDPAGPGRPGSVGSIDRVLALASRRPWAAGAFVLLWVVGGILLHEQVQNQVHLLHERVPAAVFTALFVVPGLLLLIAAARGAVARARDPELRWLTLTPAVVVVGLTLLSLPVLLAYISETVHFLQYAVVVVPLVGITGRLGGSVALATLLGAVDEAWQYWMIHPDWGIYYDFNDVVLNLLGAGLGVAAVLVAARVRPVGGPLRERLARVASPGVLAALGVLLGLGLLRRAGWVALHPGELLRPGAVLLDRSIPSTGELWTAIEGGGRFHILGPAEGLLVVVVLLAGAVFLDALVEVDVPRRKLRRLPRTAAVLAAVAAAVLALGLAPAHRLEPPPEPRRYLAVRTEQPPVIDGALDDAAWVDAGWTTDFVDIVGEGGPRPRWRTRARILWDDDALYIGAELEEPHVWASLTERDSVIFHDNDFEIFLDPDGDGAMYAELEVNALGTEWDLLLERSYRNGGPAVTAWDMAGLRTAVSVDGTLNDPSDGDRGWTLEAAIPWAALEEIAGRPLPPANGDEWRVNFSRVQWQVEVVDGAYLKLEGEPEDNWVWSPQGEVDMHLPDRWGIVRFSTAGRR